MIANSRGYHEWPILCPRVFMLLCNRISVICCFVLISFGVASGEDRDIDQTLSQINKRFRHIDVRLVHWPDDLHEQLGKLKKTAFIAYPRHHVPGKLPLLISLHGGGGKMMSVERQLDRSARVKGLSLAETAARNLILLEPNSSDNFDPKTLNVMLDHVLETYDDIDRSRIYVMGHSMGGTGTWKWGTESPERFAAVAPSGFSFDETEDVSRLVEVPIWAMVGGDDGSRIEEVSGFIESLKRTGNQNTKLTVFPGASHSQANAAVFSSTDLVDWMLGFSRDQ